MYVVKALLLLFFVALCESYKRPDFSSSVKTLMDDVAKENGWTWSGERNYDKCHILPWQFMNKFIENHYPKDNSEIIEFIKDVSTFHTDATYYWTLDHSVKERCEELVDHYLKEALNALSQNNPQGVLNALFNMPSNLFPGFRKTNSKIRDSFDPPLRVSSSGGRQSELISSQATFLYKGYKAEAGFKVYCVDSTSSSLCYSSDQHGNSKTRKEQSHDLFPHSKWRRPN